MPKFLTALLLVLIGFIQLGFLQAEEQDNKLPNILLITTDDQRYDDVDGVMPLTLDRIFARGTRFNKAYVTTPACCPSRASILTGEYASSHAVRGNRFRLVKKTFVEHISETGLYYTGLVGKYLNSWDGSKRPEYDFWVSFRGGGADFFNPFLNIQGHFQVKSGYVTDIFHSYAKQFLEKATEQEKPFFLMLNYNAPHWPAFPHPDDRGKFLKRDIPRYPNFNEANRSDKPRPIRNKKSMTRRLINKQLEFRQRQRDSLQSVDRSIAGLIDILTEQGVVQDTAIFFISDNGVLAGEHTLSDKDSPYQEASKVPCAFRYDQLALPNESDKLVANIDLAPTILDLAGIPVPVSVDGRSWLDLFSDSDSWRTELLLEDFVSRGSKKPFVALVDERYMFIRNKLTAGGGDRNRYELYDLRTDPYQLSNVANIRFYSEIRNSMRTRLDRLVLSKRGSLSFKHPKGLLGQKF